MSVGMNYQATAGLGARRKPDQIPPMISPAIRCQIPHQAAINAIPPTATSGGNIFGLNSRISASPEFWIPVSIDMVFLSLRGSLKRDAKDQPRLNANALCINTIRKTNFIYCRKNSQFFMNITAIIAPKATRDNHFTWISILLVNFGKYRLMSIPRVSGIPSKIITV